MKVDIFMWPHRLSLSGSGVSCTVPVHSNALGFLADFQQFKHPENTSFFFSVGPAEVLTMADSFSEDLEIQEAFRLSKCTPVPSDGDKKNLYSKRGHRGEHSQGAPKM